MQSDDVPVAARTSSVGKSSLPFLRVNELVPDMVWKGKTLITQRWIILYK